MTVGLLLLGLLPGCSSASRQWYGRWEGEFDRAVPSTPEITRRTINRLQIDIKPDGTFEMMESGITMSGTHSLGSERAFLTIKRVLGNRIQDMGSGAKQQNLDIVLTMKGKGLATWRDPGGQDGEIEIRRVAQPER